jgi:CDP-diglyceride synthetase
MVCGILVLTGAIMLKAQPQNQASWGIVVLVFSIASLVGMGGYFIGAVLGIAGGAIALSYRKPNAS